MTTRTLISEFLSLKRFAMIGVSRSESDFSRQLCREFLARGYDVVPVNPAAADIEGRRCFARIGDVSPHLAAAMLLTPKKSLAAVLRECSDAGVTLAWLYGIAGEKDVPPDAMETARNRGIAVISGYCPFMFLPNTAWYHRVHGAIWKVLRFYPQ